MDIILLLIAYLLGSIPFGLILAKEMGEGDLRAIGSGNIGATNALRTGNKKLATITLVCDMLKGSLAVWVMSRMTPDLQALAALVAVLGHVFPVWLKFKGGKGVATALGGTLVIHPLLFLLMIACWLGTFKFTKISALSALVAFMLMPLFAFTLSLPPSTIGWLGLVTVLIFWTHRDNIRRMLNGEELAFLNKKKEETKE